jgi:2-oxoglutarate dehydrogenase E1 component
LRETYCGTIGVEYMYIAHPERKEWLQHRMESARNYPALDVASKKRVLEKVIEAESIERFLDGDVASGSRLARYVGRAASAAPAPGSLKVHLAEQEALVKEALG